jgi:gliding motility-associated-like protein
MAMPSGTTSQNVCVNTPINTIVFNIAGTGENIVWSPAVPAGIFANPSAGHTYTIGGTPTVSGSFSYTIANTGCSKASSLTGVITSGIGMANPSGATSQNVCVNTPINTIVFNTSGTGANIVWNPSVPAQITANPAAGNTYTIGGTPTISGSFSYTITNMGCSTSSSLTGIIISGLGSPVPGTDNQPAKCIGIAITPIVYPLISNSSAVATWSPSLPAGVKAVPVGNNFVISGTPTVSGIFNYTVTTTGTCAPASLTGRIIVNKDSIALQPGNNLNQLICSKDAILPILFSISGTANTATVSGGLIISNTNNIYTVTGTPPQKGGIYTYTVTTSGTCGVEGAASITFTIQVLTPVASFSSDVVTGAPPLNVNFTNTSIGSSTAYSWDFGDGNTSTSSAMKLSNTYQAEGIYNVILKASIESSNAICWDTATTRLLIYKLTIPNVFTPNGDGKNDVFTIKSIIVANLKGEIYDRWGTKLYEWNSPTGGWDGRNENTGTIYPDGTYYYLINLTDINGVTTLEKGFVELIH